MSKTRTIPEPKLIKAMADLEAAAIAKGDELEDADPEGGLSAEGEPLSGAAPRGRGEATKKSRGASTASSPFESASSGGSSSSDSESDETPFKPADRKPKKGKKKTVSKAERSASESDDSSSDDSSSDAEKSFRARADGDETMRKAIIVNDFIEAMVDQISLAMHDMSRRVAKSIRKTEARLASRIDAQVAKSMESQQAFNARLATGVSAIGNTIQDDLLPMTDLVKSIANQPTGGPRGKALLTKGEVNQPPWGGQSSVNADQRLANGSDDYVAELRELSAEKIGDWLFKKSANNQLEANVILAWEADRYNVEALPLTVRKALANDLIK